MEELSKKNNCHENIGKLKNSFEEKLKHKFPEIIIFGKDVERICNTSFISLPNTNASDIQDALQMQKKYLSQPPLHVQTKMQHHLES